jgi:hypothetical protein
MAAEVMQHARLERMSGDDFETASIRSAAPSYGKSSYTDLPSRIPPSHTETQLTSGIVSDVPSYHSTLPPNEPLPSYSQPPPPSHVTLASTPLQRHNRGGGAGSSSTSMLPPATSSMLRGPGLPPIPDTPTHAQMPQLSQFRIPSWSSLNANPQARHYQAVANRRVSRGGGSHGSSSSSATHQSQQQLAQATLRHTLERVAEEEREQRERVRPLEDPYLVGEEAAARARGARLARESGDEILIQENRRWDLFLGKWSSGEVEFRCEPTSRSSYRIVSSCHAVCPSGGTAR